jgi:hypothetical protein
VDCGRPSVRFIVFGAQDGFPRALRLGLRPQPVERRGLSFPHLDGHDAQPLLGIGQRVPLHLDQFAAAQDRDIVRSHPRRQIVYRRLIPEPRRERVQVGLRDGGADLAGYI